MEWIKKTYVYLFSAVGLVLVVIGGVQLINLALKAWVFTKADVYYNYPAPRAITEKIDQEAQEPDQKEIEEYQKNDLTSRRQRQAANAIAMIIVGTPLFLYHWQIARKSQEK